MTKEELEKEAKKECFMLTVNTIGIDQRDVELAYVMGAEPREKRITELEEENVELIGKIAFTENKSNNLVKEIEELKKEVDLWKKASENNSYKAFQFEKENAELKAFRQDCVKLTEDNVVMARQRAETAMQLTNAKEIIRELFHYIPSWTGEGNDKPRVYAMPDKLRAKAEQFLNSEVEK